MRIDRLRVGAYGPLAGLELEGLANNDLLVVYGPNEAGKSSLRSFVASMLYGFSPAAREDHPATPADGHAHGELELELPDGGRVRVERHLRARPTARAWRGEAQEELANRPLAEVAWLERGTYLALHAFDADELRGLDAATWREIEQRLLGGASPAFLRPAALAAGDLSGSADALWRNDRRGKPRSAELSARLAALREARREALAGAQAHEQAAVELARVREELALARRDEARLDGRRDLHDRHAPALRAWQELERLRAEAEELVPEALAARVGAQSGERIEALRGELDERGRELGDLRAELETAQVASQLGEREQVLIEHAATIREAALARARRGRAGTAGRRARPRREPGEPQRGPRVARARPSAARGRRGGARDRADRRPAGGRHALRARHARRQRARRARAGGRGRRRGSAVRASSPPSLPRASARGLLAAGALLAALAALGLARARKGTRTMRAALAERSAGGSDLVASLGELRVAESRIAHPDHTLVSDIEQLRALTREQALAAAPGPARGSRAACHRARRGPRRRARHGRHGTPLGGARGRPAARRAGDRRGRAGHRAAAAGCGRGGAQPERRRAPR